MTHCGPTSAWSGDSGEWAESDEMSADCLTLEFGPRSSDAANQWRLLSAADELTPLARRSKHTLVAYNNSLYVFGGDSGKTMLNDLLKFDIRTAKWSRLVSAGGAPPAPRYHHSAVVFGGSMFVFGGYTADASATGGAAANSVGYAGTNGSHSTQWSWMNLANKNDLHEFRFSTSTWAEWRPERGAPFPCARAAHGSAVWNDRLYVFGGYDGNARLSDLWYASLASPASGRAVWCQVVQDGVGPPPTCNFACAVARDSLFVFSGQSGAKITNRLFKFDFGSGKWSQMATRHILQGSQPPPEKRYGHTMVAFGSQLYVVGGTTGQCLLNELHAYELDTETWSVVQPADGSAQPSARVFHAAAVCGSGMFVFGGTLENNVRSAELFRLQFANYPKCTLHDDFARFLQAGQLTDLLFIVGPERAAIRAHTAFVAARSSVLAEQIRARVAERVAQAEHSSGNKPALSMALASVSYSSPVELELADVAPQSFALVLSFIYTDRIRYYPSLIEPNGTTTRCALEDDDPANAQALVLMMDVYRLATRFGLARLEQLAQQYFEACVSVRNVLVGVQQAARLGLGTLKEFYLSFIVRESNYQTIIMSKEFETIEQFIMVEIVRRKQRARPACDAGPAARQPAGPRPLEGTLEHDLDRLLAVTLAESQSDGLDCLPDVLLSADGALVPAHSALLAARSAYFDALFRSFPPADRLVRVTVGQLAPTRSALESLLRYLYFGNCLMPVEDSLLLFAAPHFFGLRNNRLQALCKHNLETNVQPHNAAPLLEAADRLNAAEMRRYALSIVVAHLPTVCASPAFRRLARHLLLDVLDALAESVATPSSVNPGDSTCSSAHQPALTLTTVDGHCAPLCAACGGPQPHVPVANRRRVTVASPPPGVQQFSNSSHNASTSAACSPAASPTGNPPPCDRLTRHTRTNDPDAV